MPSRDRAKRRAQSRSQYLRLMTTDPERERERWRKKAGLPEPTRPRPAACECCDGPPNGKGVLHLDHDHETGAFRGWLCSLCNTAIGKLGDTPAGVRRALEYLLR